MPHTPHRVLIIGSGFGALFAAKALKGAPVQVTILAKTAHHLFQPLLYQVATGILSEGEIAPATREILRRQRNVEVLLGEVTSIDLETKTVHAEAPLEKGYDLSYDSLIVAAGSGQSYFGNDHFARYAPGLKSIDDALEIRGRIFGSFEMAQIEEDPEKRDAWTTFVVVGAGPTGVELAGQIAELAHRTLPGDFTNIDTRTSRIVLLDAAPRVLPPFPEDLSAAAAKKLRSLGVEPRMGAMVKALDDEGIEFEEGGVTQRIESRCKIWAAGVAASPLGRLLAEQTGAELDRSGRVQTQPDCSLPGHPEVFVVGDMMMGFPGVAQVAMQSGRFVAERITSRLAGDDSPRTFSYHDKGSMATVSRFNAVAQVGRFHVSGFVAWVLWLVIHLVYLIGFKHRVTTLLHWFVSFLGRGRSERTATQQQVVARSLLAEAHSRP